MNDFESYRNAAEGFRANKDYTNAIENFKLALSLKNDDNFVLEGLGYCYFNNREYSKCIEFYEKTNYDFFDSATKHQIFYNLGLCYAYLPKDPNEEMAIYCIKKIKEIDNSMEKTKDILHIISTLAHSMMVLKEFEKAGTYFKILCNNEPDDREKLINYGKSLIGCEKYDEAYETFLKVYKRNPKAKDILEILILFFYQYKKDYQESIKYIEEYNLHHPDGNFSKSYIKANCLCKLGKIEEGVAICVENVKNRPSMTTHSNVINLLFSVNDYEKCLYYIKEAKRTYYREIKFNQMEVDLIFHQNKYKECLNYMYEFESNYKNCVFFKGLICRYLYNKFYEAELYDYALTVINFVASLFPNDYRVFFNKGNLLNAMGEYKKAIESFNKSLELQKTPKATYNISVSLQKLNRYELALEFLEKNIQEYPNNILSYFGKIVIYSTEGKFDKANEVIEEIEGVIPNAETEDLSRYEMKKKIKQIKISLEKMKKDREEKLIKEREMEIEKEKEKEREREREIEEQEKQKKMEMEMEKLEQIENQNKIRNLEIENIIKELYLNLEEMRSENKKNVENLELKLEQNNSIFNEKYKSLQDYYESKLEEQNKNISIEIEKQVNIQLKEKISLIYGYIQVNFSNKELAMQLIHNIKQLQMEISVNESIIEKLSLINEENNNII